MRAAQFSVRRYERQLTSETRLEDCAGYYLALMRCFNCSLHHQIMPRLAVPLFIGQWRQIEVEEVSKRLGVMLQNSLRGLFERDPALPWMIWRMTDVTQQTQPFDVGAGDVAFGDVGF